MDKPAVTVEKVISTYLALRAKVARIEGEAKEAAASSKQTMAKLEAFLLKLAAEQGVDSFKTSEGTAYVTTKSSATVADWDAVLKYIDDNDAKELLERKVSKTAVREHMQALGGAVPGVNYVEMLAIGVRKPSGGGQ